jgi:glyoxylase-like metal-dependent hydrolase (beta-lactamase superfamily II)
MVSTVALALRLRHAEGPDTPPIKTRMRNTNWRSCIGAALLTLCASLGAQSVPAEEPRLIAPGVWLLHGRFERGSQPDGNSLLLQGPQGLVLVDSGRHAAHTHALLNWARARGEPIVAVINTHWHLDHLGGNALLRDAQPGMKAYAAAAVRDAIRQRMPRSESEYRALLQQPNLDADTRRMVQIDLAIYDRRAALEPDELIAPEPHDWLLAGRELRVGVERGVSGGDVWVLDRASGTLVVGDFITLPVPFLDTACPAQWRQAFDRLDALPFERVVPGHGSVMSRADFARYRTAFYRLLDCAASNSDAAQCSAGWIADLGPLLPAGSVPVSHGMLRHYLAERLRAPASQVAADCSR